MLVRLLEPPYWSFGGREWPRVGECMDVPEGIGRDLIQGGYAEYGKAPVEAAVLEPTENAAAQTGRVRGRKRG
jgi:hypothetical protein